jgi:hypothetical protein
VVELALRQHHRLVEDATDGRRLGGQSAGGAPRFRREGYRNLARPPTAFRTKVQRQASLPHEATAYRPSRCHDRRRKMSRRAKRYHPCWAHPGAWKGLSAPQLLGWDGSLRRHVVQCRPQMAWRVSNSSGPTDASGVPIWPEGAGGSQRRIGNHEAAKRPGLNNIETLECAAEDQEMTMRGPRQDYCATLLRRTCHS